MLNSAAHWLLVSLQLSLAVGTEAAPANPTPKLCLLKGRTMGTSYMVKFIELPSHDANATPAQIEARLNGLFEQVNAQMSTYLTNSELSIFNRSSQTNWFPVSKELAEVFARSRAISEISGGAFDITVGPLVNLWGFGPERKARVVPSNESIVRLLHRVGYRNISVRLNPPAVRKAFPEVYCDLSGIAKGYAVDQAAEYLQSLGIANYVVEIGGEVRAHGRNASGRGWGIGIQDPADPNRLYRTLPVLNRSVATSGDYVQYFEQDGRRYSHTIDPKTGRPISHGLTSVTVVDASCATADGLATALTVLGPEKGYALAREQHWAVLMLVRQGNKSIEQSTPEFDQLEAAEHVER